MRCLTSSSGKIDPNCEPRLLAGGAGDEEAFKLHSQLFACWRFLQ